MILSSLRNSGQNRRYVRSDATAEKKVQRKFRNFEIREKGRKCPDLRIKKSPAEAGDRMAGPQETSGLGG
jgi:hypothetical protein